MDWFTLNLQTTAGRILAYTDERDPIPPSHPILDGLVVTAPPCCAAWLWIRSLTIQDSLAVQESPIISEFNRLLGDSEARQENSNRLCAGEWPTDFSMQRYCRNQQNEGFRDLATIWDEAVTNIEPAVIQCVHDWSDGGLVDWSMIHY